MTVHGAKGLEFPVVILADITCNEIRDEAQRYVDPASGLCALRIAGCAPQELLDHSGDELRREREEATRVLYVAATRARDLLVVPVLGDERYDKWLGKLGDVLYPDLNQRRSAIRPVAGCPEFGDDSVIGRPQKAPPKAKSVIPGLHKPLVGTHRVVWWDPRSLNLDVEETMGLRQRRLLEADESGKASRQGVNAYEAWYAAREAMLERGGAPSRRIVTATELALAAGRGEIAIPEGAEIAVEELARDAARPRGPRFGTLVHAMMMTCGASARAEAIARFAAMHARILGATDAETAAAIEAVRGAIGSPLIRRAAGAEQVRREAPVLIRLDDGAMVEGVADLAFLERDGWVVVDFKTDLDLAPRIDEYRAQLSLYVRGIRQATGAPARGVLLYV
jgi:ATP-dependent exoDNAse (exonuclease V) beta subunit